MLGRNEPREIFSEPQNDIQALPRTLQIFEEKFMSYSLKRLKRKKSWAKVHMETQGVILQVGRYFQGPMTADHSLSLV